MAESIPQPQIQRSLKTWKEIAEHLGVSVRTAQLWEKERGLPVRRIEGVKGQVRASPEDLESWWQSQQRSALPSEAAAGGAAAQAPNAVPALLESDGHIEVAKDQGALQVEIWPLVVCCLLYSSLFVLDLFLEVAYRFDDFRHQVVVTAPLLAAWISLTAALGLWLGWRMMLSGIRGGFAALFGSFVCSALIAFAAITFVLPAESITILRTAPQTAQAAFLKNVVLYFLPLVVVAWLIPFHFVACLRRQILSGKSSQVQMLLDGSQGAAQHADGVYIRVEWLWGGLLVVALVSIFATQDLLSKLLPGRFSNLFMLLAITKTSVYLSLGLACVAWYSRALGSIRLSCAEAGYPRGG